MRIEAFKIQNNKIIRKGFEMAADNANYKQISLAIEEAVREKVNCFSREQNELKFGLSIDALTYGGMPIKDILICSRVYEKAGPFPFLLLEDENFDEETYFAEFGELQYFDYKGIIFPSEQEILFKLFILIQTLKSIFGNSSIVEENTWICSVEDNAMAEAIALFDLMARSNRFSANDSQKSFVAFYNSCFLKSPDVICSDKPFTQLYSDDHALLLSIQIATEKVQQIASVKQMEAFTSPGIVLFLDNEVSFVEYERIFNRYKSVQIETEDTQFAFEENITNCLSEKLFNKSSDKNNIVKYDILHKSKSLFTEENDESIDDTTEVIPKKFDSDDCEIEKVCAFFVPPKNSEIIQPKKGDLSGYLKYSKLKEVSLIDWDFSKIRLMPEFLANSKIERFTMAYSKPCNLITLNKMFLDCENLEFADFSAVDLTRCKDFTAAFSGCKNLSFVRFKNTKFPKEMAINQMFYGCEKLYKKYGTRDDYEILCNLISDSNFY